MRAGSESVDAFALRPGSDSTEAFALARGSGEAGSAEGEEEGDAGRGGASARRAAALGRRTRVLKARETRRRSVRGALASRAARRESRLWKREYWERSISSVGVIRGVASGDARTRCSMRVR